MSGYRACPVCLEAHWTGVPDHYRLNPDDYVTAVVPITKLDAIRPGFRWGRGPDGKIEEIGVSGHFHFQTRFGTTYIDTNQGDIILDYRGYDAKHIDNYPDPKKQLARNKLDSKKYGSPEGQLLLAEWCLEVGLPDEAIAILDRLTNHSAKDTFKPATTAAVEAFGKVKNVIAANIDGAIGPISGRIDLAIRHFRSASTMRLSIRTTRRKALSDGSTL
jgi:hypothetical protein